MLLPYKGFAPCFLYITAIHIKMCSLTSESSTSLFAKESSPLIRCPAKYKTRSSSPFFPLVTVIVFPSDGTHHLARPHSTSRPHERSDVSNLSLFAGAIQAFRDYHKLGFPCRLVAADGVICIQPRDYQLTCDYNTAYERLLCF